ncbi:MAG: hypothetical protein AAFR04_02780 [Pseudomonadota bacterium]
MRTLVILLAILAAGKVGYQEYTYRTALHTSLIDAYRTRALNACFRAATINRMVGSSRAWTRPADLDLVIGKRSLNVQFWQMGHALWPAKFRHPFLLVTPGGTARRVICEYDIVNRQAAVFRV